MELCSFTPEIEKQIKGKFQTMRVKDRLKKATPAEIKQELTSFIRDNYQNYTPVDSIVDAIMNAATTYGFIDDSKFYTDRNQVKELLNNRIEEDGKIDNSSDQLTDAQYSTKKSEVNRDFLLDIYGHATSIKLKVEKEAQLKLINAILFNRDSGLIIKTSAELNEQIRTYQQELFDTIVKYLDEVYYPQTKGVKVDRSLFKDAKLYYTDSQGKLIFNNDLYNKILDLATPLNPSSLTANSLIKLEKQDPERLEAFNARAILTHFDSMLTNIFGKAVDINPNYFGDNKFVGDIIDCNGDKSYKYKLASKSGNNITTWRSTDEIILENELDNVIQLLITSTPRYKCGTEMQYDGDYITVADLSNIISKIKDLSYLDSDCVLSELDEFKMSDKVKSLIKGKSFKELIESVRVNPQQSLECIFELLSNSDNINLLSDLMGGQIKNIFKQADLDILYSLNRGIFSSSLNSSLNKANSDNLDVNYYASIAQACDSIFSINFTQYYKGQDGNYYVRNMKDGVLDGQQRSIQSNIETTNGRKSKIFEQRKKAYPLRREVNPKTGHETYTIIFNPCPELEIKVDKLGTVYYNGKKTTSFTKENLERIKPFLKDMLTIDFDEQTINHLLLQENNQVNTMIKNLLDMASRIYYNQWLSNTILNYNQSLYKLQSQLYAISGDKPQRFNRNLSEIHLVSDQDKSTLEKLAYVKAVQSGLTSGSQVKNGEGSSQSMFALSRLLGSFHSQWRTQNRQLNSATRDCLLLNVDGLLKGVYTAKEMYDLDETKDHTQWTPAEFAYSQLIYDYIGGMYLPRKRKYGSLNGDNIVTFIPSVNSDKNTIGRIPIDLNKRIPSGMFAGRTIKELNTFELEQLISEEFSKIYGKTHDNIVSDFKSLFEWAKSNVQGYQMLNLNYDNLLINDFKEWNDFAQNPIKDLENLISLYNSNHPTKPIQLIDQVHYLAGLKYGGINDKKIHANATLVEYLRRFNPTKYGQAQLPSSEFWRTQRGEVAKSLLLAKFKVDTTQNIDEINAIKADKNLSKWVSEGNLAIAKLKVNNKEINIIDELDILEISKNPDIQNLVKTTTGKQLTGNIANDVPLLAQLNGFELNPFIDKYNHLDYLFTQEFMISTVGSCIAHTVKNKAFNKIIEEEAARYQAQHKRNVSFTATMQEFALNLINGIPSIYNIAILDDIKDINYNVSGVTGGTKPYDGATFVNPFVVILENNSLGQARAGITKKQFVHFYDERTGTGGIIKTAGFGITNDWMRNSPMIQRMMKKMTNRTWRNLDGSEASVDITQDYNGNHIKHDYYYKVDNGYRHVTDIKYLTNNTYVVTYDTLDAQGNIIAANQHYNTDVIDSNYKLWQLFGGMSSVVRNGSSFEFSENSIEKVVDCMNKVTTLDKIDSTKKVKYQDDVYQPLKVSDIHYCPTVGAVKQGAANINSVNTYHDDSEYNFMQIHMNQAGIQLDKEHHADQAELSLMTQVMSGCAHRGFTAEFAMKLYRSLEFLNENGTKDLMNPMKEFFNIDNPSEEQAVEFNTEFNAAVVNTVLKALSKQQLNENDLLGTLASDFLNRIRNNETLNDEVVGKIPFDNPGIYRKFLSTISVFLTNSGIRLKIPGVLSVLTPSHEIMKLYAGKKWEAIEFNEGIDGTPMSKEDYLDVLQDDDKNLIYSSNFGKSNLENIRLRRTYRIAGKISEKVMKDLGAYYKDGNLYIDLNHPSKYKKLKKYVADGSINEIEEWIKFGRNLGSYNAIFKGSDEQTYQLYDLDSIQALYDLESSGEVGKELDPIKLRKYFIENYPSLVQLSEEHNSRELIEKEIRKIVRRDLAMISPNGSKFYNDSDVSINGKKVRIDRNSVKQEAYEIVMPKTFATQFGLEKYDSIEDILNDEEFFTKRMIQKMGSKVSPENFDIEIKRGNGKHVYILHSNNIQRTTDSNLIDSGIIPFNNNGIRERLDKDGNVVYEMQENDKVLIDQNGNEIIVTDNPKFYVDKIGGSIIKSSSALSVEDAVAMLTDEEGNVPVAKTYQKWINHIKTRDGQLDQQANDLIGTEEGYKNGKHLYDVLGAEMWTSFKRALDIVAARIPAQSMQSFMPMKVVAFDNPDINTAYVNTDQIWLQGSDYKHIILQSLNLVN